MFDFNVRRSWKVVAAAAAEVVPRHAHSEIIISHMAQSSKKNITVATYLPRNEGRGES